MSDPATVTFELMANGVTLPARGVAVVDGLDAQGEPAMDVTDIGDLDPVTDLGLLHAAVLAYEDRVREQFER